MRQQRVRAIFAPRFSRQQQAEACTENWTVTDRAATSFAGSAGFQPTSASPRRRVACGQRLVRAIFATRFSRQQQAEACTTSWIARPA
jgi:hypothetical protein